MNSTNKEDIKKQIQNLSTWLWGHQVLSVDVNLWLKNFAIEDEEKEELVALTLLSEFMFFEQKEIRQMLKSLYKDKFIAPLVTKYREQTGSYSLKDYEDFIKEQLSKTRFSNVGNPSESSSMLLYYFRQRNNLDTELFVNSCQLLTHNEKNMAVEHLIYLDDLSGSGSQAIKNLKIVIHDIRRKIKGIKISYFMLFATSQALKNLNDSNIFDNVETVFELDETYKIFSDTSRYFGKHEEIKKYFQELCRKHYKPKWELGEEDISKNLDQTLNNEECGFSDTQLGLGFFYNMPNNTLPIFWADSDNWKSIFKRYSKQYAILKKVKK